MAVRTHPPRATGLMWEDILASTLITSLHPHPHEATSSAPGSENSFLGPGVQRRALCDCSPSRPSSVSPTLQLAQNCYSDHATLCPAPAVAPLYLRFSMTCTLLFSLLILFGHVIPGSLVKLESMQAPLHSCYLCLDVSSSPLHSNRKHLFLAS